MLTVESPVAVLRVPFASCANVFTTQLDGKPLMPTGGPKKQVASAWQPPGSQQPPSLLHSAAGFLTQCLVACGPVEQSARLVPKLATRLVPSGLSRIVVAFSGMSDGATVALPPPM